MHATVRRNEAGVGTSTEGLRQAVVRDLLAFEGFRSANRWMTKSGSWAPG
jgi:hypothetical protein